VSSFARLARCCRALTEQPSRFPAWRRFLRALGAARLLPGTQAPSRSPPEVSRSGLMHAPQQLFLRAYENLCLVLLLNVACPDDQVRGRFLLTHQGEVAPPALETFQHRRKDCETHIIWILDPHQVDSLCQPSDSSVSPTLSLQTCGSVLETCRSTVAAAWTPR
jgi:hypothetical protein